METTTQYVQLAVLVLSLAMVFVEQWIENSPERKRKTTDAENQAFAAALDSGDVDTMAVMLDERMRSL